MPEQAARYEADAWDTPIQTFLKGKTKTTLPEVAQHALGLSLDRIGTIETRRIAAILKDAGWNAKRTEYGRYWAPPRLV